MTKSRKRGVGNGPVAGRFVLFEPMDSEDSYITSWNTWKEAQAAFPIEGSAILRDDATGRTWANDDPSVSNDGFDGDGWSTGSLRGN